MLMTYTAYVALLICIAGILWRVWRWSRTVIGPDAGDFSPWHRLGAMLQALGGAIFSRKLWAICRVFIVDVLVQRPIARQSKARWLMHMGLFYGVVCLVLLHALDDLILADRVADYAATLNPYMFLRNILGLMMAAGLVMAWGSRRRNPVLKRFNAAGDRWLLALLAVILITGITLEASQIMSESVFDEMVVDYWGSEDPEEIALLKAFWAEHFAVVFASPVETDGDRLAAGEEIHSDFCAACHSSPRSAFMAYPLARAARAVAGPLDRMRVDMGLWYVHYFASCLALALLPFGKLFHLVSVPVSLAVRAVGDATGTSPENRSTRRAMGVDACTHCGVCSRHCSVAPIMAVIDNPAILPSEKIGQVGQMARQKLSLAACRSLAQGSDICTACGRCTDLCPSGIDLQDLWLASEADLHAKGYPPPHGWIRKRSIAQWADQAKENRAAGGEEEEHPPGPRFTENPDTFWACVQCTTCTTVCPVVAASDNPRQDLDMTPQQVMNLMRLELKEAALGSRMVWDCVTCYKCQEHCPQGVPVADVLYELRNEACRRLTPDEDRSSRSNVEDLKERS
jgi:succinate dehydrogenase/fumarate reductase-like Fe-S protein